jgi:peptide/nickel transport system substrate-binding protein
MAYKLLAVIGGLLLIGYNNSATNSSAHPEPKGGRVYGGTLRINETDKYVTLYPYKISDAVSRDIANQIYEGLVKFNSRDITKVLPLYCRKVEY